MEKKTDNTIKPNESTIYHVKRIGQQCERVCRKTANKLGNGKGADKRKHHCQWSHRATFFACDSHRTAYTNEMKNTKKKNTIKNKNKNTIKK